MAKSTTKPESQPAPAPAEPAPKSPQEPTDPGPSPNLDEKMPEAEPEASAPISATKQEADSGWLEDILGAEAIQDLANGATVYVSVIDGMLAKPVFKSAPQQPYVGVRMSTQGNYMTLTGAPVLPHMNPDIPPYHVPSPIERAGPQPKSKK